MMVLPFFALKVIDNKVTKVPEDGIKTLIVSSFRL